MRRPCAVHWLSAASFPHVCFRRFLHQFRALNFHTISRMWIEFALGHIPLLADFGLGHDDRVMACCHTRREIRLQETALNLGRIVPI